MPFDRKAMRKMLVGPFGVLPTPFNEQYDIDPGVMHEMVSRIVDNGLTYGKGVIKISSAVGEGPMLSDNEWPILLNSAVDAASGNAPVMLGIHYKDTKRSIDDAKRAEDLGAIALQVTPPMFNLPTQNDIISYYSSLSNSINIGIMIYVTRGMDSPIFLDTYRKLAEFDRIVAIKWSPFLDDYEDIFQFTNHFNIIDNTVNPVRCIKLGGHGWVQTTLDANPSHDLKVWDLLQKCKYEDAEQLYRPVQDLLRGFIDRISSRTGGQSIIPKALSQIMGYPVGNSRPPSGTLTESELVELKKGIAKLGWPVPD